MLINTHIQCISYVHAHVQTCHMCVHTKCMSHYKRCMSCTVQNACTCTYILYMSDMYNHSFEIKIICKHTHTHTHNIHAANSIFLQEHMFTQTQTHMSTVTAQTGTCRQTHFKHTLTQHKHTQIYNHTQCIFHMHAHQAYLKHGLITITSHTLLFLNSRYHTNAHSTVIEQIPNQFTWSYPVYYCVPSLPWWPALTSIAQPTVIVPQDHLLLLPWGAKFTIETQQRKTKSDLRS